MAAEHDRRRVSITDRPVQHRANKRHSLWGRWVPVAFYVANVALWLAAGARAGAGGLLWLAVITAPALALYLWRTRRPWS